MNWEVTLYMPVTTTVSFDADENDRSTVTGKRISADDATANAIGAITDETFKEVRDALAQEGFQAYAPSALYSKAKVVERTKFGVTWKAVTGDDANIVWQTAYEWDDPEEAYHMARKGPLEVRSLNFPVEVLGTVKNGDDIVGYVEGDNLREYGQPVKVGRWVELEASVITHRSDRELVQNVQARLDPGYTNLVVDVSS